MPEPIRTRGTARALGVSENTIRRWEKRGLIPAVHLPSSVRRPQRADIKSPRAPMYDGLPPLTESGDVVTVSKAAPLD